MIEILTAEIQRGRVHHVQADIGDTEFIDFFLQAIEHPLGQVYRHDPALVPNGLYSSHGHDAGAGRHIENLGPARRFEADDQAIGAEWKETRCGVIVAGGNTVERRRHLCSGVRHDHAAAMMSENLVAGNSACIASGNNIARQAAAGGPEEPETGQYSMALSQDERASTGQVSAPPVGRATPDIVASTHVTGTGPIIF